MRFENDTNIILIIVLLLTTITCQETGAVVTALHKKGFRGKDTAASKITLKSTFYQIIHNFKERGSGEAAVFIH